MTLSPNILFDDRYLLQEMKGRGSYGEVWRATDSQLGLDVAIKVYIALDQRGVEEFKSEFVNTFGLNHPNLLHAYYYDICDDRPYLVMPYCPKTSVDFIGRIGELEMWHFIRDVASGLAYLHEMGVVHHDIKPDNILMDEHGNYLITDFGISVRFRSTLRNNSEEQTQTKIAGGSLSYMAPEMFSNDPIAVNATDIWAFGVTLYEMLTSDLPFFGQGGVLQLNGAMVPKVQGDYSEELKRIVRWCMSLNTWDRPMAKQLADLAQQMLDGQKIRINDNKTEIALQQKEARRKAEEEAKRRAEEEARKKAEEEARRRKAEEVARRKAEEARRKAEEEARKKAEEEARKKAEEEARRRKAEEEARRKAEEARRKAEEKERKREEEEARRLAKKQREEEARKIKEAQKAEKKRKALEPESDTDNKRKKILKAVACVVVTFLLCGFIYYYVQETKDEPIDNNNKDLLAKKQENELIEFNLENAKRLLLEKTSASDGFKMLSSLANSKDYEALFLISRIYFDTDKEDTNNGVEFYQEEWRIMRDNCGLEGDNARAHQYLMDAYQLKGDTIQDYALLYELGYDFLYGRGVEKTEWKKARWCFERAKASAENHPDDSLCKLYLKELIDPLNATGYLRRQEVKP